MRKTVLAPTIAALLTMPAGAAPPREESPAPRDVLAAVGAGNSDEEMAKAIASADAHPLGTLENPIRVAGPTGAHAYLGRLRCADGATPRVGPENRGGIGAFGSVTTVFQLTCGSASPTALVFDIYQQEHVETRPAPGFSVAP